MGAEDTKGLTGSSSSTPSAPPTRSPNPNPNYYGTFQGVAYTSHPKPNHTVIGIPPPAPPPPVGGTSPYYYPHGYHPAPGYVLAEVRPLRQEALSCCGLGLGWMLFISGFFFAAIPWYIGALILACGRVDYREKAGLVACMVASILTVIAILFGATGGAESW